MGGKLLSVVLCDTAALGKLDLICLALSGNFLRIWQMLWVGLARILLPGLLNRKVVPNAMQEVLLEGGVGDALMATRVGHSSCRADLPLTLAHHRAHSFLSSVEVHRQ